MRGWEVIPDLYIMGSPRPQDIEARGITAILCVSKKNTDEQVIDMVDHHVYYPIKDGKTVEVQRFEAAAQIVNYWLGTKRRVLVHCLAGRNRSAVVATLAAYELGLVDGDPVEFIRSRRGGAIWNPFFEQYMRSWP